MESGLESFHASHAEQASHIRKSIKFNAVEEPKPNGIQIIVAISSFVFEIIVHHMRDPQWDEYFHEF